MGPQGGPVGIGGMLHGRWERGLHVPLLCTEHRMGHCPRVVRQGGQSFGRNKMPHTRSSPSALPAFCLDRWGPIGIKGFRPWRVTRRELLIHHSAMNPYAAVTRWSRNQVY